MKRDFLVVYDYGQGGVWAYIRAESADEIKSRYPELEIREEIPKWMSTKYLGQLRQRTLDVDDTTIGLLAEVVDARPRLGDD